MKFVKNKSATLRFEIPGGCLEINESEWNAIERLIHHCSQVYQTDFELPDWIDLESLNCAKCLKP